MNNLTSRNMSPTQLNSLVLSQASTSEHSSTTSPKPSEISCPTQ